MNPWRVTRDASLRARNSFGVQARAPWLVELADARALPQVLALPQLRGTLPLVLGGGSNLLFAGDAPRPVLSLDTHGIALLDEHDGVARVRVDAGVNWHALVKWSVAKGLMGLENLALIPGTTGAAPIQNIGAYGTELAEFVGRVEGFDHRVGEMVRLDAAACCFGYRDSVFKQQPDRYIVTAVEFWLARERALRLDYAGIGEELALMGVDAPGAREVATAVERIRRRKLPDPARLGNAGSFFKNPIVAATRAAELVSEHAGLPVFPGPDGDTRKLSAAWLIDACGWKGVREGDAGVSPAHALVLVNHGQASGAELLVLARRIAASVNDRFDVPLEPEPRLVGARW